MKILFVGQNLQIGGIQTALINTLKELSDKKNIKIDLFLFSGGELESDIPKNINVIYGNKILNLISTPFSKVIKKKNIIDILIRMFLMIIVRIIGSNKLYSLAFRFSNELDNYDVGISYFNDVPNNYFNQGTNKFIIDNVNAKKKIAWIHIDPIMAKFDKEYCGKIYKEFDKIVCVSKACMEKFNKFLPEYSQKTDVVYNLFPINGIEDKANEKNVFNNEKIVNIITVARIDNQHKRIDRIIEVCKRLKKNNIKNYKWTIVGEGPDLKENILKVNKSNIGEYLEFIGNKSNPYPYIKDKDLFVLTSDLEGYPMVIGEALILKVPIVTTNYAASHEQVKDNFNGFIVEMSIDEIYKKLEWLIKNPQEIKRLKCNILNDEFSNLIALNQLFNVLEEKYE